MCLFQVQDDDDRPRDCRGRRRAPQDAERVQVWNAGMMMLGEFRRSHAERGGDDTAGSHWG